MVSNKPATSKEELLAHAIWLSPFSGVDDAKRFIKWFDRAEIFLGVTDWDYNRKMMADDIVAAWKDVHGGETHPCG